MRKHIFNAGPCKLSDQTLQNTAKAIIELDNCGQSILEVSHRSKDFQVVIDEAVALFHEVMNIPENYHVLFLGGGASTQFAMLPFNFLKTKAAYVDTGTWSSKAIKEAKLFGQVEVSLHQKPATTHIIQTQRLSPFLQMLIICTSLQTTPSVALKFLRTSTLLFHCLPICLQTY